MYHIPRIFIIYPGYLQDSWFRQCKEKRWIYKRTLAGSEVRFVPLVFLTRRIPIRAMLQKRGRKKSGGLVLFFQIFQNCPIFYGDQNWVETPLKTKRFHENSAILMFLLPRCSIIWGTLFFSIFDILSRKSPPELMHNPGIFDNILSRKSPRYQTLRICGIARID